MAINDNNQEVSLPGFVTYKSFQFQIANPPFESIGTYQFGIKLGFQEYPSTIVTCLKKVMVQYITKFKGTVPQTIVFPSDKPYELVLPEFTDVFGKPAKVSVQLDETLDFFIFDQTSNRFSTYGDLKLLPEFVGDYKGVVTLTDSVGNSINYDIKISVTNTQSAQADQSKKVVEGGFVPVYKLPPPVPKIQYIDMRGRVRVSFNRAIMLPTFTEYPEFKDVKFLRQNCTNGNE